MSTSEANESKIRHSTSRRLENFEQDEIGVKKIADVIEFIIGNLDSMPFVIGLNSSWGTGKTEFLRMWSSQLKANKWNFIAFNSWENDFLDDPLVCLLGELGESFEAGKKSYLPTWKGVKEAATFLIKKSVPGMVKHATLGAVDVDGVGEAVSDAANDAAEKAIESHSDVKSALSDFREKLAALAAKVKSETGNPLLILVDELDRCRPNFALEMLEAIKHLFEVENVVFVLAYDGDQLACSTQAVYGVNFDGKGYLQRFFNIELQLPKAPAIFMESEANRMGLNGWISATSSQQRYCGTGSDVINSLKALAIVHQFELRTIQRILTRLSVVAAGLGTNKHIYSVVLAPLVVLTVTEPKLVKSYLNGDSDSTKLVEAIWPKEKLHRLFPGSGSDSTLTWTYACSIFFFAHIDFVVRKMHTTGEEFNKTAEAILKSRNACPGDERLKTAFEHLERDHSIHHWNHSSKQQLKEMIEDSSASTRL